MLRLPLLLLPLCASCFYVSADDRTERFDLDGDGVARPADCDDDDPEVGEIVWYADADQDGSGDPGVREKSCEPVEGYVLDSDDCDDADPEIHPGATEICNGADDDCNGEADDGAEVPTWYVDDDGDQQGDPAQPVQACEQPNGAVANSDDCDDSSASVKLGGIEVACNGIDDDCDELLDLDDPDIDPTTWWWYRDGDGDLYGDELATGADAPVRACTAPAGFVDLDGDCDDGDILINPGVDEECNGYDDDCDTVIDPYGSVGSTRFSPDADGDGRADVYTSVMACEAPGPPLSPYTWYPGVGSDCDDTNPCSYPGAIEYCGDNEDNDCNTLIDDNCQPQDTGMPGVCP